jgi:2-haloacid dehalogenase
MINFHQYKALTFDCYGTLIDWEKGILGALKPLLLAHNSNLNDDRILELFAEFEAELEQGEYIKYRGAIRCLVNHGNQSVHN